MNKKIRSIQPDIVHNDIRNTQYNPNNSFEELFTRAYNVGIATGHKDFSSVNHPNNVFNLGQSQ